MKSKGQLLQAVLLALILLIAFGVRLFHLRELLLMEDEFFHAQISAAPWSEILRHCTLSPTYPAWYLPYKVWTAIFPSSDFWLKAHSLFWGMLGVLLIFFPGRRLGGWKTGLVASLMLALLGFHVHYSQVALHYTFICVLGVLIPWTLLRLLERGGSPGLPALAHALCIALALLTYPSTLLIIGGELAALLLLRLARAPVRLRPVLGALFSGILLGAGGIYLMTVQWPLIAKYGHPFIPEVSLKVAATRLHNLVAYRSDFSWTTPLEVLVGLVLLWSGGRAIFRLFRQRPDAQAVWPCVVLFSLGGGSLMAYLLSGLLRKDLLYEARFITILLPSLLMVLASAAAGDGASTPRTLSSRLMGIMVILAVLVPQSGSFAYLHGGGRKLNSFPVDKINAWIHQRVSPGDVAVVHHSWYKPFFSRYYPHGHPRFFGAVTDGIQPLPFGGVRLPATPQSIAELLTKLGGRRKLFLILSPGANKEWRDPDHLVQKAMDLRYDLLEKVCFGCKEGFPAIIREYQLTK